MPHQWQYKIDAAANFLRPLLSKARAEPKILMILGSGFRDIPSQWTELGRVSMKSVPNYPTTGVLGHGADLIFSRIHIDNHSVDALVATGRVHLYEGRTPLEVAFPVFLAEALYIKSLLLTNAAGGLKSAISTGAVLAISDQINLTNQSVAGACQPTESPRFIDMAHAYDPVWRDYVIGKTGITSGVYAGMSGPCFETAAEANMLRIIGADMVGMSTIQETIAARMCNIKVFGCSFITNQAGSSGSDHGVVLHSVSSNTKQIKSVIETALSYHRVHQ